MSRKQESRDVLKNWMAAWAGTTGGSLPVGNQRDGETGLVRRPFGRGFNPKEKGAYQVQLKIENGGMGRQAEFTWKL